MGIRRDGKLFFDNARLSSKHILAKDIPADVIWFDEKFEDYVQDFFELLFDGDLIDHSKKYRFRVAEVEASVFSTFFKGFWVSFGLHFGHVFHAKTLLKSSKFPLRRACIRCGRNYNLS